MAKEQIVIGIDQSYKRTGITVLKNKQIVMMRSVNYEGCRNNTDKRETLESILEGIMEDLDYISTTSGDAQATTSGDAEGGHAIDDADISALVNQAILYMYENSVVTTTSGEAEEKKENE